MTSALHEEIQQIRSNIGNSCTLAEAFAALFLSLSNHADELTESNTSIRIQASDTDEVFAVSIINGKVDKLERDAPVAVTVSGTQQNLTAFIRGEISAPKAVLLGKIVVRGNLKALTCLVAFV